MLEQQRFRQLDEDERRKTWEAFYERIVTIAEGVCKHHAKNKKDKQGHKLRPCIACVKTVREVTFAWHLHLRDRAVEVAKHAQRVKYLPFMGLHHAYEAAAGLLEPDAQKATERFGPL